MLKATYEWHYEHHAETGIKTLGVVRADTFGPALEKIRNTMSVGDQLVEVARGELKPADKARSAAASQI